MKGDPAILDDLNRLLTGELTAMDVYFVQSRMLHRWGYSKLHERLDHEMDDEKGHADDLIQRILYLGGTPDMASRLPFVVGADVQEMLERDLELELDVARHLNEVIARCVAAGDNGTRVILDKLLVDTEEDHIRWLEAQLQEIGDVGLANYLAEMI